MSASFHPEDLLDRRLGHMLTNWEMDKRGEYISIWMIYDPGRLVKHLCEMGKVWPLVWLSLALFTLLPIELYTLKKFTQ